VDLLLRLVREAGNLAQMLIETSLSGAAMSELLRQGGKDLRLFGGQSGQRLLEELARGAVGCVVGTPLVEAATAIWKAFQVGDRALAARTYRAHMPLFAYMAANHEWSVCCTKTILHRGGILKSARVREPSIAFDEHAIEHLLAHAMEVDLRLLRA
jgi:dihydrodipicolinate synthase/N-acetylneuraminate lyase